MSAVVVVTALGMAHSILWNSVVHGVGSWTTPGDLWGTFRDAHVVAWGGEGILYSSAIQPLTGFISLPAMPVVLAPFAALCTTLHLTSSLPLALARPSAWLILGPVEMASGATVLFPIDALARHLGVEPRRRTCLVWIEACLIWPVVAFWGHPEDLIALALGIYGLLASRQRRWRRAGILLGLGIAFQPLVIVIVPLAIASLPRRHWAQVVGLLVAPGALLLTAPLAYAFGTSVRVLVEQPTYPALGHPTPWLAFATVVSRGSDPGSFGAVLHSSVSAVADVGSASAGPVVAGGPVRLVPLLLALAVGVYVRRRHPTDSELWWLAASLLAARCVFEPVMTPYYAAPGLALAVVVAGASTRWRLAWGFGSAIACTVLGYRNAGAWPYYLPLVVSLLLAVLAGWPCGMRITQRLERQSKSLDPDPRVQPLPEASCGRPTAQLQTTYQ